MRHELHILIELQFWSAPTLFRAANIFSGVGPKKRRIPRLLDQDGRPERGEKPCGSNWKCHITLANRA